MKRMVKDLYDVYTEQHPQMIGDGVVYIRVWTALEPIKEYFVIGNTRKVEVYEVRKYTDKTMCIMEACFRSVFPALSFLEKYEACRCLEVEKKNPYKEAEFYNF